MKKRSQPIQTQPVPVLLVTRDKAKTELLDQVKIGEQLRDRAIRSLDELEEAQKARYRWKDFVSLMLKKYVSPAEYAKGFEHSSRGYNSMDASAGERLEEFRDDMKASLSELQSAIDRLALLDEPTGPFERISQPEPTDRLSVFVVHGHDEGAREGVARFLEKLGLTPVILHEKPNRGRTIFEKLEGHSSVGFAVVLLTPDDVGGKDAANLRPRARQNVLLELGFFCGILTRAKVCALYKGGLELPSDFDGVAYVPFDDGGAWRMRLARELKACGFVVDFNRAV